MTAGGGTFFRLVSRNSIATLVAVAIIVLLCWWYLVEMAAGMGAVDMGEVVAFRAWTPSYFIMMFTMWTIMMIAMMFPSATPMILLYRQVAIKNHLSHAATGTALFVGGYAVIWTAFSLAATLLQWLLEHWALLSPMMRSQDQAFSGAILIFAGLYQWSPWKNACLRHCRGPFFFVTRHWRPGLGGAFRMGLIHGGYCLGCCSALMALLFVGGVMDLMVIAVIAIVVLLEKLMPGGEWLARCLGTVAVVLGGGLVVASLAGQ